jgi:hypothetical protein
MKKRHAMRETIRFITVGLAAVILPLILTATSASAAPVMAKASTSVKASSAPKSAVADLVSLAVPNATAITFGNVSCSATINGGNVYGYCGSPSAPSRSVTMHFGCNLDPVVHTANATPQYTVTNGKVYWVNYPSGYCWQGANNVYFTSP